MTKIYNWDGESELIKSEGNRSFSMMANSLLLVTLHTLARNTSPLNTPIIKILQLTSSLLLHL